MDHIIIRDLVVYGIIGINEKERIQPQKILINLVLSADLNKAGESDDISDTVNYKSVSEKVRRHAQFAQRFTVEALAVDIAKLCLEFQKVEEVSVRVEKPTAMKNTSSVGVEIIRKRND